jgi:hypothetical protein
MNTQSRFAALLLVQKDRVERAFAQVHERNAVLRQRELDRENAFECWEDSCAAYRLEQGLLAETIASNIGLGTHVARFSSASARCELCRARLAQMADALAVAEASFSAASAAAAEARSVYRRTLARQDALVTLAASWRKDEMKRIAQREEQEA